MDLDSTCDSFNIHRFQKLENTGAHFVDFTIAFFNLIKCKYRTGDPIRFHSQGFQVLTELNQNETEAAPITMSEMADRLQITKQQLTRLSNDLEEKSLIMRVHDPDNRRQVYIQITKEGQALLLPVKREILADMIKTLAGLKEEELFQMDQALSTLAPLIVRFETGCKETEFSQNLRPEPDNE